MRAGLRDIATFQVPSRTNRGGWQTAFVRLGRLEEAPATDLVVEGVKVPTTRAKLRLRLDAQTEGVTGRNRVMCRGRAWRIDSVARIAGRRAGTRSDLQIELSALETGAT